MQHLPTCQSLLLDDASKQNSNWIAKQIEQSYDNLGGLVTDEPSTMQVNDIRTV
jgi:hypothetical protein